jgi:hypothetical protein
MPHRTPSFATLRTARADRFAALVVNLFPRQKKLDNLLASLDTAVSPGCSDGDDSAIAGNQIQRRHVEGDCS